ncbi:hypothetical protein DZA65_00480 [Dickeya dianthicola]|uniref:Uncharacterized protein n=2 Tax=Dickeya dianthicola TaxID=204039 RepID=A0AAP2G7V2_9GAMM|nr:hypothetical protein DZA65_00480 [Dickeya dianthicola]MBQ4796658.1 hypothetical protein [Pectobacterium versatile]MBI0439278.1 hypothetical protein [Dickeya dianthicola]MBI0451309.1 hypothetical protein [Dickeya dianthicola]MBI0455740.1 hypothetical protein [Dickeya dianthicola]
MTIFPRRIVKILLFFTLYYLSLRYIHPYPITFTRNMADRLVTVANSLGFRDPEWFYLLVVLLINMIITVVLYGLGMRAWKYYQSMKR